MRHTRLIAGLLVGLVLPVIPSAPAVGQAEGTAGLVYDREIVFENRPTLVVDNRRQQLLGFHDEKESNLHPSPGDKGLVLTRYVGAEFRKEAERRLPQLFLQRGIVHFVPNPYAFDVGRGRLYIVVFPSKTESHARLNPSLLVVDSALNVVGQHALGIFPPGAVFQGLSYDPPTDSVYVLGQMPADIGNLAGSYSVMLHELDGTSLQPRWSAPYAIPGCQKAVGGTIMQSAVARTPSLGKVFLGCGTGNFAFTPQPGSPFVAAVDVRDPANLTTTTYPVAGSYSSGETLADPANERFVMLASTPATPVQAAWVFDERHGVFVGVVNAGDRGIVSGAIDPDGGWLYIGVAGGLLVGSHLGLKIPQALTRDELHMEATSNSLIPVRYARSLIVPTHRPDSLSRTLKVYRVSRPDYVPPSSPDLDEKTVDVPEGQGTAVDFSGDAQAFGAKVTQVGGINAAVQNVMRSPVGDYWDLLFRTRPTFQDNDLVLNDGDRSLEFGRVAKAHLSHVEAAAKAIALDRDADTAQDYDTVSSKADSESAWPYAAAQCVDFGAGPATDAGDDATASCDREAAKVDSGSVYEESAPVANAGSFGTASSSVTLRRDNDRGIVTKATATAENVVLAPGVSVGRITSTAEAGAKGRKGKATATYRRVFENVQVGTFSCTSNCDPQDVVDRINAVPALPFRAELPSFETVASPGGAQARAVREAWHHQEEVVMNHKDETALHVPALRLVHYNDNYSLSRTLYDFAGTAAAGSYNISLRESGSEDEPPAFGDVFTALPADTGLSVAPVDVDAFDTTTALADSPTVHDEHSGGGDGGLLGGVGRLVRRLGEGIRLLLTGRPHTLLAVALWCLLLFPFFIGSRRHLLVALVKGS
ncbi:MAG: hypothetical protein M3394_07165 [Actinomycetota bacterium]|nr:hypothetical protein [Actinomycetota bacterium]